MDICCFYEHDECFPGCEGGIDWQTSLTMISNLILMGNGAAI